MASGADVAVGDSENDKQRGGSGEKCGSDPATDDSSESDGDAQPTKAFHRRISTSKSIKNGVCVKEGCLLKQTSSFQRWKKRYFRLKPRKLYYAKDTKSVIFEEIDLTELSVAECSTKNANHSFQIITPFRRLILCAETRKEMEDWISALKSVCNKDFYEGTEHQQDFLSGQHNWYVTSHARPTYCNVCKEALSGVTSHGLSCEVCKFKAHKKCALKSPNNCKWTTLSSVGKDIIEDEDGSLTMPHQWMEGNLPVSAKCCVCDKTCGSVLRLQDWRCLWCRATVHSACRSQCPVQCPLGVCRASVIPPTALYSTGAGSDEPWEAVVPTRRGSMGAATDPSQQGQPGSTPLLVFVNSKSGDNQGVRFIRRFKQLLNPAQVFDLMNGGPSLGLRMFRAFVPLRVLVCAGDGSVSWVLSEMDRLSLHRQCQTGVLPLGTGNDLARVLGWGSVCDDDAQLPQLLEKYTRAAPRLLDRWSIMTYEGTMPLPSRKISTPYDQIAVYEDSVVAHLSQILHSDQHSVVISSAKVLCETVKDFIAKVGAADSCGATEVDKDSISHKCKVLNEKLDSLLKTLKEESLAVEQPEPEAQVGKKGPDGDKDENRTSPAPKSTKTAFIQREALMLRANSLKKAVRQIIEHTERAVDEQNAQTEVREENIVAEDENRSTERVYQEGESGLEVQAPWVEVAVIERSTQVADAESAGTAELPVLTTSFHESSECWDPWGIAMGQSVGAPLKDTLQVTLATIEGGLSADSSPCPSPRSLMATPSPSPSPCSVSPQPPSSKEESGQHRERRRSSLSPSSLHPTSLALTPTTEEDEDRSWGSPQRAQRKSKGESKKGSASKAGSSAANAQSPTGSRRISSGSTLKHLGLSLLPGERSPSEEHPPSSAHQLSTSQHHPLQQQQQQQQRTFPIINPLASLPMWPNLNRESLVGKVLLANADALCAAASPLMDVEEISLEGFEEKCVMNNYFGIGLDAKITLEFHNKREEHPEKCRSRTKNLMWYGVLGGKELLQRTYKNLEQRVQLECDGHRIALPSLQGIVVLNIPSYGGGSNFWGGSKEDDVFYAPAIDDKILEVVAVFGTVQMAASRVINLQHHRIAQCRSVRITVTGDEGVPVQVDGEAWVQPPGYICIVHKNRTQILCRNRCDASMKLWQERQRHFPTGRHSHHHHHHYHHRGSLTEEEAQQLIAFIEAVSSLVRTIKTASATNAVVEHELFLAASQTSSAIDHVFPGGHLVENLQTRQLICDLVASVRQLCQETRIFASEKLEEAKLPPQLEEKLISTTATVEDELRKCFDLQGTGDDEQEHKRPRSLFKLKLKRSKTTASSSSSSTSVTQPPARTEPSLSISSGGGTTDDGSAGPISLVPCKSGPNCGTPESATSPPPPLSKSPTVAPKSPAKLSQHGSPEKLAVIGCRPRAWSAEQVASWLAEIHMREYQEHFLRHDIRGPELLSLERRDLKELGITKVGHIKRILQAVADLKKL